MKNYVLYRKNNKTPVEHRGFLLLINRLRVLITSVFYDNINLSRNKIPTIMVIMFISFDLPDKSLRTSQESIPTMIPSAIL